MPSLRRMNCPRPTVVGLYKQYRQKQLLVFRTYTDEKSRLITIGTFDPSPKRLFVICNELCHRVIVARVTDENVVWHRGVADRFSRFSIDGERSKSRFDFGDVVVYVVRHAVIEITGSPFAVVLNNIPEDLDNCFEQVGFASAVLADKNIDEAISIEGQSKVIQILVVADVDGF